MSKLNVIRAWKDEEFRRGLSDAERASLPQNPAGLVDLTGEELRAVEGGAVATTRNTYCNSGEQPLSYYGNNQCF